VNTARIDKDEADFYRSPFIALCLTIGPAIGFVLWIVCEWLLDSPMTKAPFLSILSDASGWFWAYLLGLHFAVPAVVIFVVIGLAFKHAGFLSMLVSAALSPLIVIGFYYLTGYLRGVPHDAYVRVLVFSLASVAAMTFCWLLAGAVRSMR
jgi:hypothetical protein